MIRALLRRCPLHGLLALLPSRRGRAALFDGLLAELGRRAP